jgi:hypothetical protein
MQELMSYILRTVGGRRETIAELPLYALDLKFVLPVAHAGSCILAIALQCD